MNIQIVLGDITKQVNVDAIVNSANKSLLGGGGVNGAIHRAAGSKLLAECRTLHGCNTGEAKITGAYNLPCEYVIHTVGPIYRGGHHNEAVLLASAYRNCMKLALSKGIRTIAFPAISTGRFLYPLREATNIAVKTVVEFYQTHMDAFDFVRFVVYDSATKKVYDEVFQSIDKDLNHNKEKQNSQKNPKRYADNIRVNYSKKHLYRGIIYEVSEEQGMHPSLCTFCGKRTTRKAFINVHGKVFVTCEKCAQRAIDTALNSYQKKTTGSSVKNESKATLNNNPYRYNGKEYSTSKSFIDVLVKDTNNKTITWNVENSWEGNHEKTIFRSAVGNLCLQVVRYNSDSQYLLITENNRISSSYLKTLMQAIQKSKTKSSKASYTYNTNNDAPRNMIPTEKRIIHVKDFVVRRSVFKCMHNNHQLNTVIGTVTVIDAKGLEKQVTVNAGYCADCKIFFILESAYEKIRKQGIPLCRTCDEKNYLKQTSANGMMLAQESVLMQYGYTVNQTVGLSFKTRQKILATLIDYKILGKSEIISYLDFFVSQREGQSKYKYAIAKWEEDREFVENYKKGSYQRYRIDGIIRK